MSETLCTLRTKGGGGGATQTETVLWTNSAPTSNFAGQDVTLSDDINSYDYLKFTYRVTTSVADSLNYIISVSDFKKSLTGTSPHHCILGLSSNDSGAHTRRVYYKTDTSVTFDASYQINVVATANNTCIPLQIIGIKNMGGKIDNKTVSGTVSVTAGGISSTIDVGFRPKKLYVYANISSNGIINCSYDESISATTYIRGMKYGSSNLLVAMSNFGGTNNGINAIEDNGFKLFNNMSQLAGTWYYTAVKG